MIKYRSQTLRQSGFTIIELLVVMMVISIMAAPFAYQHIQKFEEDRIAITIAEVNDLFQSAQNFAAEQDGEWPSEADNCATAISTMDTENYLQGFNVRSPFGTNLSTSCTTGDGKRFIVTIDAVDAGNAELLDAGLPSSTVSGNLVTVSVPMPAVIPALEHLLPRDGSRPMTGDLDMDDNDILKAGQIEAEMVLLNSIVNKGDVCSTNGLVARDNEGNLLSCVNELWAGPEGSPQNMVAFFNSNICPDGWLESNGTNGTNDLRGEFIRGLDRGRGVDPGRSLGTAQLDQMQRLTGRTAVTSNWGMVASLQGAFTNGGLFGSNVEGAGYQGYRVNFDTANSPGARTSATTDGETRSRNVALLACQKD